MISTNAKTLEKDIENKEEELLQQLEESLLKMNEQEFKVFFKRMIDSYYKVLFNFELDFSKHCKQSYSKYKTIEDVKDLVKSKYNNLDNYENAIRTVKAEEIAYNQMLELHFMETNYTTIIYGECSQALSYINSTLTKLLELYEEEPSEAVLKLIEDRLISSIYLLRTIFKLPTYDIDDIIIKERTIKKEQFKIDVPTDFHYINYSKPLTVVPLKSLLERFEKIFLKLKVVLPDDVIESFIDELTISDEEVYYNDLVNLLSVDPDEAKELSKAQKKLNNLKPNEYLYSILR